jgi:oligopeptide transport system ATP-binding protein
MSEKILTVENLHVSFDTYAGEVRAVRGVNITVNKGEVLAIVGESGSGKSVTAQAILRLAPENQIIYKDGKIVFDNKEILKLSNKQMQKIRGSEIGMILQDPLTSLNPTVFVNRKLGQKTIQF